MDKMTIIGKDGQPRHVVGDKVTTLVGASHGACACENPKPMTVRTDVANVQFCENCGHQILADTTS